VQKVREWGVDGKQSGGNGEGMRHVRMEGSGQDLWGGDDFHPSAGL